MSYIFLPALLLLSFGISVPAQVRKPLYVIAYYSGDKSTISQYPVEKLTHIIYSFLHLRGSELSFGNNNQKETLRALTSLKKKHPGLKVLVSLGGWGGCKTCSEVFSTENGRKQFALSVKRILRDYKADGIDLDWEYPTIEGYPGHRYAMEDRENFTALLRVLREVLGRQKLLSFAAGGFSKYLEESVDWNAVMPYVDFANLMTYDLVNGNSSITGHHTPLYSTTGQVESTDHCVQTLIAKGVAPEKLVIGAAFYARTWEQVADSSHGLYQAGKFKSFIAYKRADEILKEESGYTLYYDEQAKASYRYNAGKKEFATFDDALSVRKKTRYAITHKLGGIMFWELTLDKPRGGLLDALDEERKKPAGE